MMNIVPIDNLCEFILLQLCQNRKLCVFLIQINFEIISSLADGLVRRDERAGDVESGAHLLEDVHVGGSGSSKH
jgi:hypothetical protein